MVGCCRHLDGQRLKRIGPFRSFVGYSNANYALSEVKDPIRTIKRAAPVAMLGVSTVYILINIAYFAVVSKNDILNSRRIIAYVPSDSLRLTFT